MIGRKTPILRGDDSYSYSTAQDPFAEAWLEGRRGHGIDLDPETVAQLELETHKIEEAGFGVECDQEVEIALGGGVVASPRAEDCEAQDVITLAQLREQLAELAKPGIEIAGKRQSRSTTIANPTPPAAQTVASPRLPPRRRSS